MSSEEKELNEKLKIKEYLKKQKEKELIRRGLCELKELDGKKEYVPFNVTDEEFEDIIKCKHINQNKRTKLPIVFYVLGVLLAVNGLCVGKMEGWHYGSQVPRAFLTQGKDLFIKGFSNRAYYYFLASSIILAVIMFGIGKIISLLDDIKNGEWGKS